MPGGQEGNTKSETLTSVNRAGSNARFKQKVTGVPFCNHAWVYMCMRVYASHAWRLPDPPSSACVCQMW